jgi:Holliday junction resolvase-like predicted endonuclease
MTAAEYRAVTARDAYSLLESQVLDQVRQYLRTLGWYVIRIQQGIACHKGISDLIVVKDGRTVFLECKTKTGRLSQHQKTFQNEILSRGRRYVSQESRRC